jgi:hypothetical protein
MLDSLILNQQSIESIYRTIESYHSKYLKKLGVKIPRLKIKGEFTRDALVLVYLAYNYPNTRVVTKNELTNFVRTFYPNTNDMQQARHLGAQKGWWIVAGGRDNIVLSLKSGEYQLYTLEQSYPSFKNDHRLSEIEDWGKIKEFYNYRCATCGSQENQPNLHWRETKTKLQQGHMNPRKPLVAGNIIPQCQKCNQADRDRWVYDDKGRVIKINNPSIINFCDEDVQLAVYKILQNKYVSK